MNDQPVVAESTAGDQRQCRLNLRVITMGRRPDPRARFPRWRTDPSTGTARRHWAEAYPAAVHPCSSTFLRPFAPSPLQALRRSYGRSDSCPPGSSALLGHEHRLSGAQVSLISHPTFRPFRLQPPAGAPNRQSTLPMGVSNRAGFPTRHRNRNSGLRHLLADSPHSAGRIEFSFLSQGRDFLRTGRSPPAAPHPVSPRRSCRLITSYVDSERTFTSLIVCALRRTGTGVPPVAGHGRDARATGRTRN